MPESNFLLFAFRLQARFLHARLGMEKERESVEIRLDAMEAHAEKNDDWSMGGACGSNLALDVSSNECVPDEGFEGGMGKVKTWMR
ncbi:hypothetical protein U1Q18_034334 [Sarracenia purpurea var. burkii]